MGVLRVGGLRDLRRSDRFGGEARTPHFNGNTVRGDPARDAKVDFPIRMAGNGLVVELAAHLIQEAEMARGAVLPQHGGIPGHGGEHRDTTAYGPATPGPAMICDRF